jgi:hypothetical protein
MIEGTAMKRRDDRMEQTEIESKRAWAQYWATLLVGVALVTVVSNGPAAYAVVVTDNFSDLNDTANPTWTHLDKAVATTGQKWNASTGAYRLCTPTSPTGTCDPANATFGSTVPELPGYDFVGAHVGPSFTDVRVTADIVDFVPPGPQSSNFGVAARMNGNNNPPSAESGLQLRGYSYEYEGVADYDTPEGPMYGEMVLKILHGGGLEDIGAFGLTLDTAKDYRVVFEVIGNTVHGQVFEVTDVASGGILGPMVADQFRDLDANPPDMENYDGSPDGSDDVFDPSQYASGVSGVYGIGHIFTTDADFTIDNFRAESIGGGIIGDYNENGTVDAADYVVWRENAGTTNTLANDDISGTIGQAHYDQWRANFGSSSPGSGTGSAAVPEPAAVTLALLSLLIAPWGLRRQSRRV